MPRAQRTPARVVVDSARAGPKSADRAGRQSDGYVALAGSARKTG